MGEIDQPTVNWLTHAALRRHLDQLCVKSDPAKPFETSYKCLAEWVVALASTSPPVEAGWLLALIFSYIEVLPFIRAALMRYERTAGSEQGRKWRQSAEEMMRRNPQLSLVEAIAFHAPSGIRLYIPELTAVIKRAHAHAEQAKIG